MLVPAAVDIEQFVGGWGALHLFPAEAVDHHLDAADLGDDVLAGGEFGDCVAPAGEVLVVLAGVRAHAERTAEVVEDDRGVGEGAGEVGELGDLRVVEPGLEAEVALAKLGEALAVGLVQVDVRDLDDARVGHVGRGVPAGVVADAAEAVARRHVSVQHLADGCTQQQISVADDARAGPQLAVESAGALGGDAGDVLGLADRGHGLGGVGVVHRAALDEDGLADVEVACVLQQFIEEVAQGRAVGAGVPEVVVRVDDLLIGVDGGFLVGGEPVEVVGDHSVLLTMWFRFRVAAPLQPSAASPQGGERGVMLSLCDLLFVGKWGTRF